MTEFSRVCPMCEGTDPAAIVFHGRGITAWISEMNVRDAPFAVIAASKVHSTSLLTACVPTLAGELVDLWGVATALIGASDADGATIRTNVGAPGQEIAHRHWHLLPRYRDIDNDGYSPYHGDAEIEARRSAARAVRAHLNTSEWPRFRREPCTLRPPEVGGAELRMSPGVWWTVPEQQHRANHGEVRMRIAGPAMDETITEGLAYAEQVAAALLRVSRAVLSVTGAGGLTVRHHLGSSDGFPDSMTMRVIPRDVSDDFTITSAVAVEHEELELLVTRYEALLGPRRLV